VAGEDVEDQLGPIEHLHVEDVLQAALLPGRQLLIADHGREGEVAL
jgi:hypothetical protein